METKKPKWNKIFIILAFLILCLLVTSSVLNWQTPYENKLYDLFTKFKPQGEFSQEIIYLRVNAHSDAEGFWPWGKDWLSYLVNFLSGFGVKAIGIDPSLSKSVLQSKDNYLFRAAEAKTALFYPRDADSPEVEDKDFLVDSDAKVRRFVLLTERGSRLLPSLILKLGLRYRGLSQNRINLLEGREIEIADSSRKLFSIPLVERGEAIINFDKHWRQSIKEYSYFDVALSAFLLSQGEEPKVDFADFKNKIIFIGMCPEVIKSAYPVPVKSGCGAIEIRLNMLNNIIRNNFIRKLRSETNLLLLLASMLAAFFISINMNLLKRTVGCVLFAGLFISGSFFLFSHFGVWADTLLPLLSVLFTFSGVSIYRYGQGLESRIEERRRELARKLKLESLPKNSFSTDKFSVVVKKNSPKEVKGDFYDILELDSERLAVIIGSSPGKNLEGVNYIIKTLNEFRLQSPLHKRPRAILNAVNNALFPDGAEGMYLTCIYFELDPHRGTLTFANAGEEPFLLARQANSELETFEAPNPTPLGVAKNVLFSDHSLVLRKGDLLVAFTRGVIESKNKNGIEFGIERMKEVIEHYRSWEVSKLANKIFERIHRFSEGRQFNHECSLLLIRIKSELKLDRRLADESRKKVFQGS